MLGEIRHNQMMSYYYNADVFVMNRLDSRSCFLFLLCFSTCMRMSQYMLVKVGRLP